jgi:hypothetical protein
MERLTPPKFQAAPVGQAQAQADAVARIRDRHHVSDLTGNISPGIHLQSTQFLHGDSLEAPVELPIFLPSEHLQQRVVHRATTPALPGEPVAGAECHERERNAQDDGHALPPIPWSHPGVPAGASAPGTAKPS